MATLSLVFRVVITITIILRLVSSLQSSSTTPIQPAPPPSNPCIPSERDALLDFKKGLTDPDNYLSSWQGDDCCAWMGISCSKRNGHVVELWLNRAGLGGKISSSLLALRHLKSLGVEGNDFGGAPIPEFIGSFKHMKYLYLFDSNFSGQIPPHLGNLSELLDLQLTSQQTGPNFYSTDLAWLARLSKLEYLYLDGVNLSTAIDWTHSINMLPSLVFLSLSYCSLRNAIPPPVHINLTSLKTVYLSGNPFNSPISFKQFFWPFWALPSLENVYLGNCGLQGSLPEVLGNSTSLKLLDLNNNDLTGVPITLKRLHTLETLHLAENNFNGSLEMYHFG
ncbi:receptor-like protein EIX2 [Miscanthus floridulus]|uniref:receptor-like protein EIX2 n=1 Tax=Miscanthus floridulus TaxID=154761 RepID=UPI003457C2D4